MLVGHRTYHGKVAVGPSTMIPGKVPVVGTTGSIVSYQKYLVLIAVPVPLGPTTSSRR